MVTRSELQKKYKLKILLKGPTGTGKCAKKGTLMLTDKGLIKIEDIIRGISDSENRNKDNKQSSIYDTFDCQEEEFKDSAKSVNNVISVSGKLKYDKYQISGKYDMGVNDLICLKTSAGFEISGTPEHKVVVIDDNGNLVFRRLDNIANDDYVVLTHNTNIFNDRLKLNFCYRKKAETAHPHILKNIEYMNEDIARLLGYAVAEGTDTVGSVIITNYDKEIQDDIVKICGNIGLDTTFRYVDGKNDELPTDTQMSSIALMEFLYYLGYRHGARVKEIPWSILQADKSSQIAFIRALFDSDGTINQRDTSDTDEDGGEGSKEVIEYYSSSYELCRQLQVMLLNIGILARLNSKKGATNEYRGELVTYEESYRLSIQGGDILKFAEIISFGLSRKKEILDRCVDILNNRSRWTTIVYPNIGKKLGVLYEKLKYLGRYKALTIRYSDDAKDVRWVSAKKYLEYHEFKQLRSYISGVRSPSRDTLRRILDILSPTRDMKEYKYLDMISSQFMFDKVEEIKKERENVYDVTIDGVHSYIGNGFVNHNTLTCVKIAEEVAKRGWKVLYLDHERGSEEELMKLDDKTLENIIHEDFKNYQQIMDAMKKHKTEQGDKLKLIIVDPMYLVEMTRLSARDAYLDQGYYYLGEKKVDIDNKETFDLRGFMYQLGTTYQMKLANEIISCNQDIVCTLMTPNKHETDYDGKFSIVLETFSSWVGNKIYYKAIPKKMRGVDLNAIPAIDNPYKKLLEGFIKKYDAVGNPSISAEDMGIDIGSAGDVEEKVEIPGSTPEKPPEPNGK
jgi:intein/homing endonuclease